MTQKIFLFLKKNLKKRQNNENETIIRILSSWIEKTEEKNPSRKNKKKEKKTNFF
jgi:hypothetical protein